VHDTCSRAAIFHHKRIDTFKHLSFGDRAHKLFLSRLRLAILDLLVVHAEIGAIVEVVESVVRQESCAELENGGCKAGEFNAAYEVPVPPSLLLFQDSAPRHTFPICEHLVAGTDPLSVADEDVNIDEAHQWFQNLHSIDLKSI